MKYTFWKLIKETEIEIPIIQRDYAQGRTDERVSEIRKKFIKELLNTIDSQDGKKLNLDFVYGKTHKKNEVEESERNQENVRRLLETVKEYSKKIDFDFDYDLKKTSVLGNNENIFVPLDGQQRLTTLFLLHFYIGTKLNADVSLLNGFKFKTRKSSSEFCDKLISNRPKLFPLFDSDTISNLLQDQVWFFTNWKKDPTVAGMLVTLDEIEDQIKNGNYNLNVCWQNLTNGNVVLFEYFDLKEHGLEDELYVKMNARGKHLTDFENFKAWLQDYAKKEKYKLVTNWEFKLDKDWLDIFWSKNEDRKKIDYSFLQFFKNMASIIKIEDFTLHEDHIESEKKQFKELSSNNFLSNTYFKENKIFNELSLSFIFDTLEILELNDCHELDSFVQTIWISPFYDELKGDFSDSVTINYNQLNLLHKTFIYAVLQYLIVSDKRIIEFSKKEKENFSVWLRVIRNLIYNTRIDDDEQFFKAIKAIKEMNSSILDINKHMSSVGDNGINGKWISFFLSEQQKEEYVKHIVLDESWNQSLTEAENHAYFYGQISFIIDLAKNQKGEYDLAKFNQLFNRLGRLFEESNFNIEFIIQRALLCIGGANASWMKNLSYDRYSFYSSIRTTARQRDENWRYLFNHIEKRKVLLKLVDKCDCSKTELLKIIEEGKSTINDWRNFFISGPVFIEKCNQRLILWTLEGDSIFLLGESRLSHYHRELRSYALYCALYKEELKEEPQYEPVKNASENPYVLISKGEKKYQIVFNSSLKKFQFKMETENPSEFRDLTLDVPFYKEINEFNVRTTEKISTHIG
jgi:hypothetical protein